MALFPGSLPSFAGFTAAHTLAADNHAAQHNLEQGEIVQIATKVGTGSSTSSNNTVLRGNGSGTSGWAKVDLTTDVTGTLPVANGGTGSTSSTGSGAVVLATSPTITTPVISDLSSATHTHQNNTGGGILDDRAVVLRNANALKANDSGATARNLAQVDSSNRVVIGDTSLKGGFFINGCFLGSGTGVGGSATAIADSTGTDYPFNESAEELYDPLGMHDPSNNPARVTAKVAGTYMIIGNCHWNDAAGGVRITDIQLNGSSTIGGARGAIDGGGRSAQTVFTVRALALNDYVTLTLFQSSGGNLTPFAVSFGMYLIGP